MSWSSFSPFLRQTIKNIEKKYNSKVIDIRFREKHQTNIILP